MKLSLVSLVLCFYMLEIKCFFTSKSASLLNCKNLLIPNSYKSNEAIKPSTQSLSMNLDNAVVKLQEKLQTVLSDSLALKLTDFTSPYDEKYSEKVNSKEVSGVSKWFDETKGSKLTGIASYYYLIGKTTYFSISGWVGPISPVPHFILSIQSTDGVYRLTLDYIPRGSFPLGSDQNYFNQYFSNNILNTKYNTIYSTPNTFIDNNPEFNYFKRLLKSPIYIDISGLSFSNVEKYSTDHINQWISWLSEAAQVDTRQRAGYNTRDDKLRQFYFQSNYYDAYALIDDKALAQKLAVSWTGPLAEAYVGGSS